MTIPAEATREIEDALAHLGVRQSRLMPISDPKKGTRFTFRVEQEGGPVIKVRLLESADAVRRLLELRTGLEESFAPAIGYYDRVLIEAWIDGEPLPHPDARVEEAGHLLGKLHAREVAATPAKVSTGQWRDRALANLEHFGASGTLDAAHIASLDTALRRHDPGTARMVLVHGDFCDENMIVDARQRLCVIDNEAFAIDAAGMDLGRTFSRWPMSESAWERFVCAYEIAADVEIGPLGFWQIALALWGLRIRFHFGRDPSLPLARLRRLAAEPGA